MRVGIVGYGYVGKAVYNLLEKKHEIIIKEIEDTYNECNTCDVVIICVPTPMMQNGEVDISIIEEAVKYIECGLIIIKSTIPPGTSQYLANKYTKSIVFSPEYIGEGNYPLPYWEGVPHPTDMSKHEFTIFGGPVFSTRQAIKVFKPCLGPYHKYIQTDWATAELTKYMENSWIATKVTFCNEFYEIARHFGVDYNELRELWLLDKRISRSHTLVSDTKGFSGKCIPKDTNGIIAAIRKKGYEPEFMKEVLRSNDRFRGVKDATI